MRAPAEPGPWQIFESAGAALCALIEAWGGTAQRLAPARDEAAAVIEAVAAIDADLIVTVGGASVGDYDIVKPALARLGLELQVQSVNIRPGKPTWFGRLGPGQDGKRSAVLGLPGNPASALVCAEMFLKPLIRAMLGADPEPRFRTARLQAPLPANGGRTHLMRALLDQGDDSSLTVSPLADQDSSLVTVFARANGLLLRPAGVAASPAGALVAVLPLERL